MIKVIKFQLLSILFIALNLTTIAQVPQVSNGEIQHHANFPSKFVDARHVDVWLPEGYTADKKYPVLYMHDGQMLFDSTITWNKQEWQVDEIMSQLQAEARIKDCIVVGIWNNGIYRRAEYLPEKAFNNLPNSLQDTLLKNELFGKTLSDEYLKFIVQELKPFIDSSYSTYADMANTFISGSSMGGLISHYAICEYPEVFGGAACLSTHWPGSLQIKTDVIPNALKKYVKRNLPSPKNHKIYFDYGTATLDAVYEPYQLRINELMKKKGFDSTNWKTLKFEGEAHTEKAWSKRLHIPLTFLLGN